MKMDDLMRMNWRKGQVVICVDAQGKVIRSAIDVGGHLIDADEEGVWVDGEEVYLIPVSAVPAERVAQEAERCRFVAKLCLMMAERLAPTS
jgi:hypothetical protein